MDILYNGRVCSGESGMFDTSVLSFSDRSAVEKPHLVCTEAPKEQMLEKSSPKPLKDCNIFIIIHISAISSRLTSLFLL